MTICRNLSGADIHNANVLRPKWQQRALGAKVLIGSPGQQAIADTPGRFVLLPQGYSSTRLLLREALDDPLRSSAFWVLWDPRRCRFAVRSPLTPRGRGTYTSR